MTVQATVFILSIFLSILWQKSMKKFRSPNFPEKKRNFTHI